MANGRFCGEKKNTLATMLGSDTLWGERYFAGVVSSNLLEISCWIGSVDRLRWGVRKNYVDDDLSVAFG